MTMDNLVLAAQGNVDALQRAMIDGDQLRAAFLLGDLRVVLERMRAETEAEEKKKEPLSGLELVFGPHDSRMKGQEPPEEEGMRPSDTEPSSDAQEEPVIIPSSGEGEVVSEAPPVSAGMRWRDVL